MKISEIIIINHETLRNAIVYRYGRQTLTPFQIELVNLMVNRFQSIKCYVAELLYFVPVKLRRIWIAGESWPFIFREENIDDNYYNL